MNGFESIFQDLFGASFGQQEPKSRRKPQNQREDLTVKLDIDFKDAVNGTKKVFLYLNHRQSSTIKQVHAVHAKAQSQLQVQNLRSVERVKELVT